jgi:cytochrome c5
MTNRILILSAFVLLLSLTSCYYDKAELLQTVNDCDTSNVTFAVTIAPIIQSNCQGCHSGGAPASNISLTNFAEIKAAADNGSLMGSIKHLQGFSAMPKGGNKLSDCDINKLEIWISKSTPNN